MLNEDTIMLDYIQFSTKFGLTDKYVTSEVWSRCINIVSSNDGKPNRSDDDNDPDYQTTFERLDRFIIQNFPNMGIVLYKKLYDTCVKLKRNEERNEVESYDDDTYSYYEKIIYSYYFECDLEKFYNFLVTNNLLSEHNLDNLYISFLTSNFLNNRDFPSYDY
jgi:hypothetical protein